MHTLCLLYKPQTKTIKDCVTLEFSHRTWAEIDLTALLHNFKIIKELSGDSRIMAVVKANAYGHNVAEIAPSLQKNGVDFFAVSNIDEALQLREIGITVPILILGYTPIGYEKQLYDNDISQCVYSYEYAKALSENAVRLGIKIKVHIKLDTGMSRLGFNCRSDELTEIDDAVNAAGLEGFLFEGVFTHFAVSDRSQEEEDGFTNAQFARFTAAQAKFKAADIEPKIYHCCNSAALVLDADKRLDYCRPGIILYGLNPSDAKELKRDFIPVMTLKSVVSMVKEIAEGDTVSYGRTFTAKEKMRIATVTAGYADGYPRALSGKGYVLINGKKAPIIGRVCMDQLSVDVSDIPDVKMGDEVILFGKDLPCDEVAKLSNTINYEIVCGVSPRVPRIIVGK